MHAQTQFDAQIQANIDTMSTQSQIETHNEMQAQSEQQQESKKGIIEYLDKYSPFIMLAGAITGGIWGSIGAGFGNVLIGFGTSVETINSLKDIYKAVLSSNQRKAQVDAQVQSLGPERIEQLITSKVSADTQLRALGSEKLNDLVFKEVSTLDKAQTSTVKDSVADELVELYVATAENPIIQNILGLNSMHFSDKWGGLQPDTERGKSQKVRKARKIKITDFGILDSWQDTLHQYVELKSFAGITKKDLSLIIKLSSRLLTDYMKDTDKNRKSLLNYDKKINGPIEDFIFDLETLGDIDAILAIISKQGKQKLHWHGFIYEWIDTWTGVTMTGKTRAPHGIRKQQYVIRSVYANNVRRSYFYKDPHEHITMQALTILGEVGQIPLFRGLSNDDIFDKIKSSGIKIHGLIFQYLDSLGLIKYTQGGEVDRDNLDFNAIHKAINDRFEFHFKFLAFSPQVLSDLEINRIKVQWKKGVGLNKDTSSLGGPSADHVLAFVTKCISLNLDINQMVEALSQLKYEISPTQLRFLINHNFGGLRKAKDNFFFPLVKELHRLGYSNEYISHTFTRVALRPYLSDIDRLFSQGYDVKRIISRIFPLVFPRGISSSNVETVIKEVIILMHPDIYTLGMTFKQFTRSYYKQRFLAEIRLGALDFTTLASRFEGFVEEGSEEEMGKFRNFFTSIFKGGIKGVFKELLTDQERNRIIAIHLLKEHINDEHYGKRPLCSDLRKILIIKKSPFLLKDVIGISYYELLKIVKGDEIFKFLPFFSYRNNYEYKQDS